MGSGIPVPPVIPEGSKAFILCVPDDPFFYGVVMGALKVMTFKYYWAGTDDEKTAVTDRMLTMYYDYQEQVGCMICDMVAECFETGNEALIEALANAIRSNPLLQEAIADALTQQGGGVPGRPLTTGQATGNLLPDNVRDEEGNCIDDNLWGAMLYVVQSGNRVITDFFEVLEAASNTLESMTIISKTIPAAGDYISAAGEFADQIQENIAEGYAGAYTEAYEQSLACDMFCLARAGCELSIESILVVINDRLTAPLDLGDFGEIMAGIASGTWVGDEIADVAFLVYFSALRFGQQFGDQIGIRPLPVIMSLGADQLASDNWEVLCDCPTELIWENVGILGDCGSGVRSDGSFAEGEPFEVEAYEDIDGGNWIVALRLPPGNWLVTLDDFTGSLVEKVGETAYAYFDGSATFHFITWGNPNPNPTDFPPGQETTRAIFTPWCTTQDFNVMLNNGAPFTATFSVTAA